MLRRALVKQQLKNVELIGNEFAASAVGQMHGLCRRFFFAHFREPEVLQKTASLHAALAKTIADGDEEAAAKVLDELMDHNETVTRIKRSSKMTAPSGIWAMPWSKCRAGPES